MARKPSAAMLLAVAIVTLMALSSTSLVVCQDFEDLNHQHPHGTSSSAAVAHQVGIGHKSLQHHAQAQQTFQPLNRQAQSTFNNKQPMQRPLLSNRFSQSAPLAPQAASSSASAVFASPSSGATSTSGAQNQPVGSAPSGINVEQLMKNALARTAQLNAVTASTAEQRQDTSGSSLDTLASPASAALTRSAPLPAVPAAPTSLSGTPAAAVSVTNSGTASSPSESASTDAVQDESNPDSGKPTAPHETVYSDQRFANLFARRNNAKKSRIQPVEQVKAKPTLPSFIKSPPDPKQFAAAQSAQDKVAAPSSSSNTFAAQRVQQANQNRVNLANQQLKKGAITSTSANLANNKRTNGSKASIQQNNGPNPSSAGKSSSQGQKANTSSVSSKPASQLGNNPFNRAQSSNSDPANVIAMARKRLLANNALESAKAKQQSQKATTN